MSDERLTLEFLTGLDSKTLKAFELFKQLQAEEAAVESERSHDWMKRKIYDSEYELFKPYFSLIDSGDQEIKRVKMLFYERQISSMAWLKYLQTKSKEK